MKICFFIVFSFLVLTAIAQLQPVNSGAYKWSDFPVKPGKERETRKILEGTSSHLEFIELHATTQFKGAKPNPPKSSDNIEEVVIVKEGKLRATVEGTSVVLGPGGVILLMPKQMHSLENIGDGNLTYYVMEYRSKGKLNIERGQTSGSLMLNRDSLKFIPTTKGGGVAYFDRPTAMCERFEMHITQLNKKGESHAPHKHIETEIILIISGNTEMTIDGKEYTASAGDLYLMESESFHGIRNAKDEQCSYFAFKWK